MLLRFGQACLRRFCATSHVGTLLVMPWSNLHDLTIGDLDDEGRRAKQSIRSLEIRRAGGHSTASPSSVAARRVRRRQYVELLGRKLSLFRTARGNANQSQPRRLWRSFNEPLTSGIAAANLQQYFDNKVKRCS